MKSLAEQKEERRHISEFLFECMVSYADIKLIEGARRFRDTLKKKEYDARDIKFLNEVNKELTPQDK